MTQTIEQLTARVRELEEENARLNGVIESNIDDGIDKIMAMSDEQVSALAGFEGSNPEDKATIARQCMDIAMLRVDLAASQLHAEQLRAALEKIGEVASPYRDGVKFNYIADISQEALLGTKLYLHPIPTPEEVKDAVDGYKMGCCTDNTIRLHYETSQQAEKAFDALTLFMDKAIGKAAIAAELGAQGDEK